MPENISIKIFFGPLRTIIFAITIGWFCSIPSNSKSKEKYALLLLLTFISYSIFHVFLLLKGKSKLFYSSSLVEII